ncbi:MAG: hypothetical protein ACKO24_07810, partial [Leptolyngbyaceae cyanobacterium]
MFRRQWSSVYAALQDHRLPRAKVLKLLVQQIPTQEQPLLAGNASRWQLFWWLLVHPRRRPNHGVKRQDGARATVRLRVLAIRRSKNEPRNAKNPQHPLVTRTQRQLRFEDIYSQS